MSRDHLNADPAAVRAALVTHLAVKLAPLFTSGHLRTDLATWLAPLSTLEIARCLRVGPEETAEGLTLSLLRDSTRRSPSLAIADVVALEHPKHAERERLVTFTEAVQSLAKANDGAVTERDLFGVGYGLTESRRLMPLAQQVLAVVDGRAAPRRPVEATAADRLIEAGVRASARLFPATAIPA